MPRTKIEIQKDIAFYKAIISQGDSVLNKNGYDIEWQRIKLQWLGKIQDAQKTLEELKQELSEASS